MQGSLTRSFTDYATQTFTRRCHDLGLAVYRPTPEGKTPCSVQPDAHSYAWLTRRSLVGKITLALSDSETGPVELEPGVFLLRITESNSARHAFGALALTRRATEDTGFEERCKADGVDPDEARLGLSTIKRQKPTELTSLCQALTWSLSDLRTMDEHRFAAEDLTEQLGQSFENITLLYRLGRSMSTLDAPRLITESVCNQVCETQSFGWVAAHFRGNSSSVPELTDHCVVAGELPADHGRFKQLVDELVASWSTDSWSKLLQPGAHPLADLTQTEIILDPIYHDGQVIGVVLAGGKTGPDAEATSNDTQLLDAIASFLGTFHENAARFNEQQMMFIGTLEAVSAALDAKDPYTYGHSERVAHMGVQLARAIGLSDAEVERIRIAGLVHDVGKIGVPEAVLCKAGKLTDEEYEQIKRHPRVGYNILKGIPKMEDVLDGVLYHHERWDGRGYPDRLSGENIPLYGRILAVADTFDAMSSTRSYRKGMPRAQVLEEILRCAGSQFDPRLTGPFVGLDFTEFDELVRHHEGLASQAA